MKRKYRFFAPSAALLSAALWLAAACGPDEPAPAPPAAPAAGADTARGAALPPIEVDTAWGGTLDYHFDAAPRLPLPADGADGGDAGEAV